MATKAKGGRPRNPRPNTLSGEIGACVEQFREKAGFTQPQLAERAGLSLGGIGGVERGDGSLAVDTLKSIADALGISLFDILKRCPSLKT